MSFLNPPTALPKLCVNMAPLIALRDLRSSTRELDLMRFVLSAEEAGADAIEVAVDPSSLARQRTDIDTLMGSMTERQLAMPLAVDMIDFAATIRPHSVCFDVRDEAHGTVISDSALQLISKAVAQLRSHEVRIVLSIGPATLHLQALAERGH